MKARRWRWLLAVACMTAISLAARADDHPLGPGKLHWIIQIHALDLIRQTPGGAALADAYFDNSKTYVLTGPTGLKRVPSASIATESFKSVAAIAEALAAGTVDRRIRAILYDAENWTETPRAEQIDQAGSNERAAGLIRGSGRQFLSSPASNLADVMLPDAPGSKFDRFVATGIAEWGARYADLYEIQAQGAAMDPQAYRRFVAAAAAQARRANPSVVILAGLSTNPAGQEITVEQLFQAVLASRDLVSGYWLNLPGRSKLCPACTGPRPDLAVALLQRMATYRGD